MTLLEAIRSRHSVRNYQHKPLSDDIIRTLNNKIEEINTNADLNIQLITNETKAFRGILAYGKFSGVENYLVMAGKKGKYFDEKIGYYGEKLVLLAQQLGLNSCWAGLSYKKIPNTYHLNPQEHIACYIAIGYGITQGQSHKVKALQEVSNADHDTPEWFINGVKAALLAPTAINQQKFYFKYYTGNDGKVLVSAQKRFSMVGYTAVDLGIAKLHFEIGAGTDNFDWE